MNLYLVQHASAKAKEDDPERSLSDAGLEEVGKMVDFLKRYRAVDVTRILHSGKRRAEQTAVMLGEQIRPAEGVSSAEGLEPVADASVWAERLSAAGEDVMLVGHLPHLGRLASLLLCRDANRNVIAFRNAGIVCLRRDETGSWLVNWMTAPEVLE
jgi:phosphohistidine phosphatase